MASAGDEDDAADTLMARLVSAALEALADKSADALSLRKVAHGSGVSHQAPYVHFGSRRRFLAAVAGAGLQQAANEASAAVAAAGQEPRRRLQALARSYLDFIRTRPHVHDLAYGPTVAKRSPAAAERRDRLLGAPPRRGRGVPAPGVSEPEVLRRSAAAWGTVYGIARLSAFHRIPASVPTDIDGLIHTALDALMAGWQTRRRLDSDLAT